MSAFTTTTTITVPPEYGYVILTATSTFFLGFWHGVRTTGRRKPAGVMYPAAYADSQQIASADADKKKAMYLFNCAQRAHANYLENLPALLTALLISGLRFPLTATALGLVWAAGRIVYAVGYTNPNKTDGKGRTAGSFFWFAQLGLFLLTGFSGYKLVVGQ